MTDIVVTPIDVIVEPRSTSIVVSTTGLKGDPGASADDVVWESISGSIVMQPRRGYICNGVSLQILTLPVSANTGDRIYVSGQGSGLFRIAQNSGQQIRFGDRVTSLGLSGRIDAIATGDALTLLCVSSSLWAVLSPNGNFEVA